MSSTRFAWLPAFWMPGKLIQYWPASDSTVAM